MAPPLYGRSSRASPQVRFGQRRGGLRRCCRWSTRGTMHLEALTDAGAKLFPNIPRFDGFYLTGGTALALQIGHRISVDFDLFSNNDIPQTLLAKVRRVFPNAALSPIVNDASELTVLVDDVKLTFLRYPFPVIEQLVTIGGLQLLSVKEIAATKAYTIGRRGALKDYVDLYCTMGERHASLTDIITLAEQKFGSEFNSRLFLEQLVFLDDIEDADIAFLRTPVSRDELTAFFEKRIRELSL
jgi:Nucleotidyl transferase AbiEii toxin, Type IV TA system